MDVSLEEAIGKLDNALGMLEAAVNRRIAVDHARADLETELQIMQDDRARLAVELDSASNRLGNVEAATQDVSRRVTRAIATIEEVLAHQEPEARSGASLRGFAALAGSEPGRARCRRSRSTSRARVIAWPAPMAKRPISTASPGFSTGVSRRCGRLSARSATCACR